MTDVFLRAVANNSDMTIIIFNRKGICTLAEGPFLPFADKKSTAVPGCVLQHLLADQPEHLQRVLKAFSGEASKWIEQINDEFYRFQAIPVQPNAEFVESVLYIATDVNALHLKSQQIIKEHEAFVNDIFTSIQDGIFIIDAEYTMTRVNKAFEEMYPEHMPLVGKKCWETSCIDQICDGCPAEKMFKSGKLEMITHYEQPTGEKPGMWLEHYCHPVLNKDGVPIASISLIRDITAKHEAEEQLIHYRDNLEMMIQERTQELQWSESKMRALLSGNSTPIVFTDTLGIMTFVNVAFEELTGFTNDELLGTEIHKLYAQDFFETCISLRNEIIEGKTDKFRADISLIRKDGVPIWTDLNASVVLDASGNVAQFVDVFLDVTERWKMMAQLNAAKTAAEGASEAKSQFLATMSHEIRTPLNGVIGLSELMLGTELNQKQHEYAQLIKASGQSLLFIINDILDFSKIEAGKLEIDQEPFDIVNTVESTLGILSSRARDKSLEICASFDYGLPRSLIGDAGRIRQVLLNLIGNAIKFTEKGGVHIAVSFDGFKNKDACIYFSVSDTGIGIPEDRMHFLFKAFSQTDSSSARIYGGTGLGLAISMQLVKLMGGEIGANSTFGFGSAFWFKLPLMCNEKLLDCRINNKYDCKNISCNTCPQTNGEFCIGMEHFDSLKSFNFENKTVLIVDDNPVQRACIAKQLSAWKLLTQEAASRNEALEKLNNGDFSLIVIDETITDGNGIDLMKEIRTNSRFQNTSIIVLLPMTFNANAEMFAEHRAEHVSKPVCSSQLFNAIMTQFFGSKKQKKAEKIIPVETIKQDCHILVAEDNRINQIVVKNILTAAGYSCDIALNGREAYLAVMAKSYDLVLMDCQMPEMDGYEATNLIRRWEMEHSTKRIPIIALTANATKNDVQKCFDLGMDAYCSKPIDPKNLVRAIDMWINEREMA